MQKLTDNFYVLLIIAITGTFILVLSFVMLLLRSQKKLLAQREQIQHNELLHQKLLLRSVIESQDAERIRIGRDLHDDVGAALSNLNLIIERFLRIPYSVDSLLEFKQSTRKSIDQTIKKVRNISHNLSPEVFTLNTLSEALEELCDSFNHADHITVDFNNDAETVLNGFELNPALSIYRIVEELITNTIKHADATEVIFLIAIEHGAVSLNYQDNGKGLNTSDSLKKGRGMQNIESRLGLLNASSNIGKAAFGFSMEIKIPVHA
ncbi:sensor histidine kinase [Pedobacter metabolipauper]|uniref:histidine kinase n=1 Tax=Pedobacter metabolipauper TaxID=425513 RepID=A0A4V6PW29_9SPHI|nr:histidine kinase [Pedobacter metabolipauper]TDQ11803.1 histidine kinase [Pedobacter metabolipauper]